MNMNSIRPEVPTPTKIFIPYSKFMDYMILFLWIIDNHVPLKNQEYTTTLAETRGTPALPFESRDSELNFYQ